MKGVVQMTKRYTGIHKWLAMLGIMALLLVSTPLGGLPQVTAADGTQVTVTGADAERLRQLMADGYDQFIVIKHRQLGGSHYAYTEGVSDEMGDDAPEGRESVFEPGSEMVKVTLTDTGSAVVRSETTLLYSPNGVLRDPDVSTDGTRVLFSWKKDCNDDYHLYEMDLRTETVRQLTFGQGVADIEPKYLPNGEIIFSSTRTIQTVDCWYTPVSNLFLCGPNGEDIVRLGFDQVHTTYPTVTPDGRVLYTRWDYNDRTQMFVQAVFQMFPDGTNQTEVFGNNSNFPTTLLHTRALPTASGRYISIATGHHTLQAGKLVLVDTNVGRNDPDAITFISPDAGCVKTGNIDAYGQTGMLHKYPYPITDTTFLVSSAPGGWDAADKYGTPFNLYYMDIYGNRTLLSEANPTLKAGTSQAVPVASRTLYERPSTVDYGQETGIFYISNIYEGEGLKGVAVGQAKYLRVVALSYRSSAIGATYQVGTGSADPFSPVSTGNGSWDVKQVLGIVDIEPDGSALFSVPARLPVFFQVLDKDYQLIQSMRSWSTLMPGETFSCVGCHENKNTVPPVSATPTMAMAKGVQQLRPEIWQDSDHDPYSSYQSGKGFSYLQEVQPILDAKCITCHNDKQVAHKQIGSNASLAEITSLKKGSEWAYTTTQPAANWYEPSFNDSGWKRDYAPFGTVGTEPGEVNTLWTSGDIWMRTTFSISTFQLENYAVRLQIACTQNPEVYVNGKKVWSFTGSITGYREVELDKSNLINGQNVIAVKASKGTGGQFIDCGVSLLNSQIAEKYLLPIKSSGWRYMIGDNAPNNWYAEDFDDSLWKEGTAMFGNYLGPTTVVNYSRTSFFMRKTFTIDDISKINNKKLYLEILYDESPVVYINGKLIYSTGGYVTQYRTIDLTSQLKSALREGVNTIAVKSTDTGGNYAIDCGIAIETTAPGSGWQPQTATIFPTKSGGWKYVFNQEPGKDWHTLSFNDAGWNTGTGLFGTVTVDGEQPGTRVNGTSIYLRKTFTLTQAQYEAYSKGDLILDIFYDESPRVYINGELVYNASGYVTQYQTATLGLKARRALRVGTNVLAVSAVNTAGGFGIDVGLRWQEREQGGPISLEGDMIAHARTKRYWPLSYLVLTQTKMGTSIAGNSNNDYISWIDSMSQCEMLEPNTVGSGKSYLIQMLRAGHHNVQLTEQEMATLCAWIDLAVPCCGTYDENNNWDNNAIREFQEKRTKREYYQMLDAQAVRARAGEVADGRKVTISYKRGGNLLGTVTGSEVVRLEVNTKFAAGDVITVTLPKGEKYLWFTIDSRIKGAILYVPSGTFTYTVPADISRSFAQTVNPASKIAYSHIMITARIPTKAEIEAENRNLTLNPFDLTGDTVSAYPHVTASSFYSNAAEFAPRNVMDGYTGNLSHGTFPSQSWGPSLGDDQWIHFDFGRTVTVSGMGVYIRADFPHDTHYVSGVLEFSDGSTETISLRKTAGKQTFAFTPRQTTYVKLKELKCASNNWAALTEVEIYGSERYVVTGAVAATRVELSGSQSAMKIGETQQLTATVSPSDVTNPTILWTSSNPMVATVDRYGRVQALTIGKTVITATTQDGGHVDTYTITVYAEEDIPVIRLGDVDDNGKVNATDARLTLQYSVKKITFTTEQMQAADVDGNGTVNTTDARLILQRAVEKISKFPIE